MTFPFTPDRDWSNVPEGETAPPGAPVADDAWFEAVEDALHEHDAHQDAVYAVHGGLVGYVGDSDDPPTAPPNGLMWFRTDTDERVINTGTSGAPVWDQLADDVYKLTTADLVSDYVISGLLPSVPTPTSLSPTIPSGAAYIIGKRVVKASGAHTVPARKATLVDLSDDGVYSNVDYGILLDDTEDVWNEKTDADFTTSVVAGPTGLGNAVRFAIASGASAGDSVSEAIPVADLSGYGKIAVWMRSSVTTTSGQLQFLLDDTASVASPVHTLNVPALTANTWTLCEMAYTSTTGTNAIISIGLKYTSDIGAANVDICKPFALKSSVPAVSADSIRLFEARASANIQQVNTVTVTSAVNSTIYTVTVNGVDNTYTSDADATTAEIAAGLAAAINASVDVLVTPVTATYVSGATFTVSADVAGAGFTIAVGTNLSQASTVANSAATVLSVTDMRDVTPTLSGVPAGSGVAEDIIFTPFGTIEATDVQGAIEEVASEVSGGGGYNPPWIVTGASKIYPGYGDGDPNKGLLLQNGAGASPTPTNIGTTVVRCVRFRLPVDLSVAHIYLIGQATVTGIYTFGIYPVGTGATLVWDNGGAALDSANDWVDATAGLPVVLTADTDYWWCMGANTTGVSAGWFSPQVLASFSTFWGGGPFTAPPSMGIWQYAQFATTAGAMPGTLPAVSAPSAWTGSIPIPWFVGTAS